MATFVLSVIVMLVVVGGLSTWAFREQRRRSRAER
jgi:hypothetical protein